MRIRPFAEADRQTVLRLWHEAGLTRPWNDPLRDMERKRSIQPQLFLVGLEGNELAATAMAGYDGHRGWIYYLAVASRFRRLGLGGQIVEAAEQQLAALGCPKVNLMVREGNDAPLGFYRRIGYTQESVIHLGKRLETDDLL